MTEAGGTPQLSGEEKTRYARHITLPEVGVEGQQRLKAASVLCIGAGGLGSPLLLYLAAAGVGRIGVVDDDIVDPSNLQRQVIKDMLQSWDREYPGRLESIFRSVTDVVPSHLLDERLFNFKDLTATPSNELSVVNIDHV